MVFQKVKAVWAIKVDGKKLKDGSNLNLTHAAVGYQCGGALLLFSSFHKERSQANIVKFKY